MVSWNVMTPIQRVSFQVDIDHSLPMHWHSVLAFARLTRGNSQFPPLWRRLLQQWSSGLYRTSNTGRRAFRNTKLHYDFPFCCFPLTHIHVLEAGEGSVINGADDGCTNYHQSPLNIYKDAARLELKG